MKKAFSTVALLFLVAFPVAHTATAVPIGSSDASAEYIFGPGLPDFLGCGVYGGTLDRDIWHNGFLETMTSSRILAYVSVDPFKWMTVYLGGGMAKHEFGVNNEDASSELEYEGGVVVNLIDRIILDPTLFEDRIRLSTGASITMSQGDWRGDSVDWNEVCVSMTASVVNDVAANKFFNPEAIALYVGPLFSMLQSSDLEEDNKFGLTVGVEVMVSESLSFDIGVRHFESSGVNGGLHLRF